MEQFFSDWTGGRFFVIGVILLDLPQYLNSSADVHDFTKTFIRAPLLLRRGRHCRSAVKFDCLDLNICNSYPDLQVI